MDGSDRPIADNDDEAGEIVTPWSAHRGLLWAVLGMGLLIVIGIAVVAYGLVYKMSGSEESAAPATVDTADTPYRRRLDLADGPDGLRNFAVGELLAVQGETANGATVIIILEPRTGREVGRFHMSGPPPAEP